MGSAKSLQVSAYYSEYNERFDLGFTKIQFGPVMQKLNNEEFSIVGFDTRGYGESRPPDKEITVDFLRQDADDGAALMQVS